MAEKDQETVFETDSVERELLIPAAVDEVWEVVTGAGWLADEVTFDLVPGGDARFMSHDATRAGWVEEVCPPEGADGAARLVFWWESDGQQASRGELTLEPEEPDLTRLRVRETRPLEVLDVRGIPLPDSGSRTYGPSLLMAVA